MLWTNGLRSSVYWDARSRSIPYCCTTSSTELLPPVTLHWYRIARVVQDQRVNATTLRKLKACMTGVSPDVTLAPYTFSFKWCLLAVSQLSPQEFPVKIPTYTQTSDFLSYGLRHNNRDSIASSYSWVPCASTARNSEQDLSSCLLRQVQETLAIHPMPTSDN